MHASQVLRQLHVMSVVVVDLTGAQREVHQMSQMGPREHGQRVSPVWTVWYQRHLCGHGGGSR